MPITPEGWDWNRAQAMFFAGLTPEQITTACNVTPQALSRRASRLGWTKLRTQVRLELASPPPNAQTPTIEPPEPSRTRSRNGHTTHFTGDARDRSHQFQAALQAELQRGMQAVAKLPLDTLKDISAHQRILESLTKGWEAAYTLGADNGHVAELVDLARVSETDAELNISTIVRNNELTTCPSTG